MNRNFVWFYLRLQKFTLQVKMNRIQFATVIAISVVILVVIGHTNGEIIDSKSIDVENINSSTSLESLIQKEINCTSNSTECEVKSRRKRYVAFPEGSSFSVFSIPTLNIK